MIVINCQTCGKKISGLQATGSRIFYGGIYCEDCELRPRLQMVSVDTFKVDRLEKNNGKKNKYE